MRPGEGDVPIGYTSVAPLKSTLKAHEQTPPIMTTKANATEPDVEDEPGGDDRRFQVLALDGGGVRGIFTAALLAGLEEDIGSPGLAHIHLPPRPPTRRP